MINIPIGASYDFLTVNDHEFLLNLTGEFLPAFGAVRVSTYTSYTHFLKKKSSITEMLTICLFQKHGYTLHKI